MSAQITFDDFLAVDIRAGRVVRAEPFPEARKPAIKLWVDFGDGIGVKKSSAQITAHYRPEDLPDRALAVLVLGVPDEAGAVVLLAPDRDVPPGARMF